MYTKKKKMLQIIMHKWNGVASKMFSYEGRLFVNMDPCPAIGITSLNQTTILKLYKKKLSNKNKMTNKLGVKRNGKHKIKSLISFSIYCSV